jgi:hypothetical protein
LIVATAELDEVQVTAVAKLPVPVTDAEQVIVPPTPTVLGQLALTEVMVGDGAVTFTVAVPDLVASCIDVAVTITLPAVLGAVKSPEELTVPALAPQVTAEL